MATHLCPRCKMEWHCTTPNCDGKYKWKWCIQCRIKVTQYLTGLTISELS